MRTWAEVDLGAIRQNLISVRERLQQEGFADTRLSAVVKADAYGHGMLPVVDHIQDLVDFLAVATASEAMELRDHGVILP